MRLEETEVKSDEAKTPNDPAEGADFYWERESMVFTASFHLRRGYCCKADVVTARTNALTHEK
jgi:hypothetical protein